MGLPSAYGGLVVHEPDPPTGLSREGVAPRQKPEVLRLFETS